MLSHIKVVYNLKKLLGFKNKQIVKYGYIITLKSKNFYCHKII